MVQKKRTVVTTNLDVDFLRTLASAEDLGGMNRAAERVGRSQSAVSQQMRKLEEKVGQRLFRKRGRGLVLTEPGELLLKYARRILALNDEAIAALHGSGLEGVVRFGLPSDFAETWLPAALGQFKRAHPLIRVEASVDRNAVLFERLEKANSIWRCSSATAGIKEQNSWRPCRWYGSEMRNVPGIRRSRFRWCCLKRPVFSGKRVLQRLMPPESLGGSHLRVPAWRAFGQRSGRALG
jgi:hypothetical protein